MERCTFADMNQTVLIADDVHPDLLTGLEDLGYRCDYQPRISLAETHKVVHRYCGMVINTKIKADRVLIDKSKNLAFIARLGSGLDIIDLEAAAEKEIAVLSAPEGNCNAVAEHAVGMLLALANKMMIGNREVRALKWNRESNRGFELEGKTIGIIGYGHTGQALIEKLVGFRVNVLVYDRFKTNMSSPYDFVRFVTLEALQAEATIISCHVQLNDTSYHMVDDAFIDQCKHPFYLVNTSRGKVVKLQALLDGLNRKKILGACLDVFENEKPATHTDDEKNLYLRLYQYANVVLTPHVAGWTVESKQKIALTLLKKIAALNR